MAPAVANSSRTPPTNASKSLGKRITILSVGTMATDDWILKVYSDRSPAVDGTNEDIAPDSIVCIFPS